MRKLLNIDANAKTVKGQKQGFLTAVLYLAPWKASGINVCPMAELAGCHAGCLNTAGRGGIAKDSATFSTPAGDLPDNAIQRARIARTQLYANDRPEFMRRLYQEIRAFLRKAERMGLTPAIRLNGTSDIQWERTPFPVSDNKRGIHMVYTNVMAAFPDVQFYDYTKIPKRFTRELPSNYHLTLSWSGASHRYMQACIDVAIPYRANVVKVMRTQADKDAAMAEVHTSPVVDGDEHDLRFLDPDGAMIYLKAKGSARKDDSGFVIDHNYS
jgi:hypothetical protein